MKKTLLTLLSALSVVANATIINANSSDYTTYVPQLTPGDTLMLSAGTYTGLLSINGLNGAANQPIVIIGAANNGSEFMGNGCCNTVSITQSSYIVIKNLKINGDNIQGIDAVKAEGSVGNWAHHITLDSLLIVNHGTDQQQVGISTKCPAWNWTIRNCHIDSAGTGMYLGNSTFDSPFINGIIENNLITNTIGYNIQIKKENNGLRTTNGIPQDGYTIIRYNVFSKQFNASSGGNERPNLLVGAYPTSGAGANDYYEIYGNFFYQNPYENLFQGTGNYRFYNNLMVNSLGGGGMNITTHDGVQPANISVFHNTILSNTSYGIRCNGFNTSATQEIFNNAVFSPNPIANATSGVAENTTDSYTNASNYLNAPFDAIGTLDLYPKSDTMYYCSPNATYLASYAIILPNSNSDFNDEDHYWKHCGAYVGYGTNPGWTLALDIMPTPTLLGPTKVENKANASFSLYPNPAQNILTVNFSTNTTIASILITDILGKNIENIKAVYNGNKINIDTQSLSNGIYFITVISDKGILPANKFVIEK